MSDYDPADIKHLAGLGPVRRPQDHIALPTRLWVVSDLHVNHAPWSPDITPDHDILIVAGDIADGVDAAMRELRTLHQRTRRPIVFVPGNHDYFGGDLMSFHGTGPGWPIHVLPAGEAVVIGAVRFVGATLWTDWQLCDKKWASQAWAARHLPEYNYVTRPDGELIWPIDTSDQHDLQRARIEAVLSGRHEGPTVVVTHHAPSAKSLRPGEERSVEAAAYASDLEQVMMSLGPDLWVHGHTHHAVDYHIGHTRVISNPRGYQTDGWAERTGFVEDLVIEV